MIGLKPLYEYSTIEVNSVSNLASFISSIHSIQLRTVTVPYLRDAEENIHNEKFLIKVIKELERQRDLNYI